MAKIHILGVCGTFMGGLAAIARAQGHEVSGSDQNVYPPMSTQLEQLGITVTTDDDLSPLEAEPDLVIIGNALSRGHPQVEQVLNKRLPFTSGPQWLGQELLREKTVLAVAGTHGKTTTASMLVWILEQAGRQPGFLVGGVVQPFDQTARVTDGELFVIEADEYDTAFFDKRSKFLHYHANTLLINNLEFDHADIFPDLAAIQRQFHHVIRTVPGTGKIIYPGQEATINEVLQEGCWSTTETVGTAEGWQVWPISGGGQCFGLRRPDGESIEVTWSLYGQHNLANAMMAAAAASQHGVALADIGTALSDFQAPARRMQLLGQVRGIHLYDDFAHHPTAMATTLAGLRARLGSAAQIVAIFEPRSNTMKAGVHQQQLAAALAPADAVYALEPAGLSWSLAGCLEQLEQPATVASDVAELVSALSARAQAGHGEEHWVIMSNGSFAGIHQQLVKHLAQLPESSS